MDRLIEELKRRHVLRAAALYAAAAWVLVQFATQVFPFFDISNRVVRLVVIAAIAGFPFALVISWFYEWTPAGFRRETEPGQGAVTRRPLRLALLCAGAFALSVLAGALLTAHGPEAAKPAGPSIAVLPFRNLSANADNAYFTEGIQDEILTRLTRIAALRVISRSSSAGYADARDMAKVALELGVDHLLSGSVQRLDDAVRINVQLIRADNGTSLWSDSYDRKLTDVFGVESEVARAVAASLQARLSGAEQRDLDSSPTVNPQAYDQYLRGLALARGALDAASLQGAAGFLRRAVDLDPGFAEAWALLSRVDARAAGWGADATPGLCEQAGHEADNALRLAPGLGEAYMAQGYHRYACTGDLDGAQAAFEHALRLLPGQASVLEELGNVENRRGALGPAVDYMRRAALLDPRNTELLGNLAQSLGELRRFDEALAEAGRILDIVPSDAVSLAMQAYLQQASGRLDQAQQLLAPLPPAPHNAAVFDYQALQLLYQRRFADAAALLRQALAQDLQPAGIGAADYSYLLGVALRGAGDAAGARQTFAAGRVYLESFSAATLSPDIRLYRDVMLCLDDAGAGDAAASEDCGPVTVAAAKGGLLADSAGEALARAAALRGDREAVLAALPRLLRSNYYSFLYSAPLTPALLRQDPLWDGVRGDARFAALAGG